MPNDLRVFWHFFMLSETIKTLQQGSLMLSLPELQQHLSLHFPRAMQKFSLEAIQADCSILKRHIQAEDLRPGATVSGPTLMQIADFAAYIGIIADQGIIESAFTTNLNINFLRRATADSAIIVQTRILKAGKNLATAEMSMYSEGSDALIAHAVATFALIRAE